MVDAGLAAFCRAIAARDAATATRLATPTLACARVDADDFWRPNRNGTTPLLLATRTTGRGGSGSPAARAQQREIIQLLAPGSAQE